ncbi:hypothetical protein Clacol_000331 [Clathrus columnatus]|uniref:Cytochrome P450 n=1 Tax=Clathrus columnatus TaxID=1419009 RepID=A0AAV4ZY79_9AGAM|nr:hypothetical protein Clacol_000331 [Clathrus columnatus]
MYRSNKPTLLLIGYKLPPGPLRRLIVGNMFDIPLQKEWKTYDKWAKTYGELTYLNIFGTSILVVSSYKMVSELFEQRWTLYSGRFKSTMLSDLTLLFHLHRNPEGFIAHSRHVIGAMVMEIQYIGDDGFKIIYGIKTSLNKDPYIELAEKNTGKIYASHCTGRATSGFYTNPINVLDLVDLPLVKYIPSWVPGAGFQKKAKTLREEINAMTTIPFTAVKAAIKAGNASPSIVGNALGEINPENLHVAEEERIIRDIAGSVYMAAIDTTESAVQIFFIAMLLYPDVQRKAQAELDNFLGEDKLPSFDDRKHLPYIGALCKEVLRWHPVTPVAVPHMLKEDDIIGEYFVPKGTIVIGNTWSLLHSKSAYGDDADEFNPDRFMNPQTKYPDSAFGFGRRICPGRHMADSILFILITNVLYAFNIVPYKTSTGIELPSPDAFVPGLIS